MTRRHALALVGALLGGACSPAARQQPSEVPTEVASTPTPVPRREEASQPTAPGAPTRSAASPTALGTVAPTTTPVVKAVTVEPTSEPTKASVDVWPGVDVLLAERKDVLAGQRIGLVTNATGRTRAGESTIDALHDAADWKLVALFSPEHGIRGEAAAGERVDSSTDATTGLPIYSLYGNTTRPTPQMLQGLDVLVYDIQDVGARTYTYISTLLEVMKAASASGTKVVVLDRPDPIGGDVVEGNVLEPRFASFVGPAPIAMRYGMTIGELAQFFNAELNVGAEMSAVTMNNWKRATWFDQTGLEWVNPSPNLRALSAAALYPGMVLFEGTNLSEGRGTAQPFEWIGAPWIDADAWAVAISAENAGGVRFTPAERTPESSKFAGQRCQGLSIEIVNRQELKPMELGVAMISAARAVSTRVTFTSQMFDGLAGTDQVRRAIEAGHPAQDIANGWRTQREAFNSKRQRYLLY